MRIEYRKHPDTPHWSHDPMVVLGEDTWGVWLGTTPETRFTKPDPGRDVPLRQFHATHPTVQLVSPTAWWTLIRNDGARNPWYVDIITPPAFDSGIISMIDLDLDVLRDTDGVVTIDDEDEFEHHRISLQYPVRWVDMARTTAARIATMMDAHEEPFGTVADGWLRHLGESPHWARKDF